MVTRSEVVQRYISESKLAVLSGQFDHAWKSLEIAHIISQPSAWLHVKVHWVMLGLAHKTLDWREVIGQIFRIVVAVPGSAINRYPKGNTGRSNVSAFREMVIAPDLQKLMDTISDI